MKKLIRDNVLKIEQYEPGKPIELLRRELGIEGEVHKMASNENPLGPSPLAIAAIKEALEEGNFYPDNSCYELREKLGRYFDLPIKNIRIGPSLPAFVTPTVLNVLVENYNIAPVTNANDDLAAILGGTTPCLRIVRTAQF